MTDNQVLEIINLCQANALTPQGKIGKELLPEVRDLLFAPAQGVEEAQLRQLFKNNSNCYADTWSQDGLGAPMVEGDVIQAMTEERFIEVVTGLTGSRWQQGQGVRQEVQQALVDFVKYIQSPQLPAKHGDQYIEDYLNSKYGTSTKG